jgi:hypothetical protein
VVLLDKLLPGRGIAADAAPHKRKYGLVVVQVPLPSELLAREQFARILTARTKAAGNQP